MNRSDAGHTGLSPTLWWLCVSGVVTVAVVARLWHLSTWSLWEDEEATIHYALNPHKWFPSAFPIFFLGLRGFFSMAGVSVTSARAFSVAIGLTSLLIVFFCVRRMVGRESALLAVLLLAVNIGHVFWSQSVRYYTLVLSFELLSVYCFFWGLERRRAWLLLLSNVALFAAMLTHFSAILLVPVFIAYMGARLLKLASGPPLPLALYVAFGLPLAIVVGLFAIKIAALQGMMGGWALPSARDPVHVMSTLVAYFGGPMLGLAVAGLLFDRSNLTPSRLFMLLLAIVPVLELIVIAGLNVINVTWYYAFVAVVGFAVIAADWIVRLQRDGHRTWAVALSGGVLAYSVVLLSVYQTISYGDRPRWRDAANYIRASTAIQADGAANPDIFATAPGVVAFYLGVAPEATQGQALVKLPTVPASEATLERDQWYAIPAFEITASLQTWLSSHCTLRVDFPARTGPRDRTLRVFHCPIPNGPST
jgi:predicted membrane-bound mannosyltransferase